MTLPLYFLPRGSLAGIADGVDLVLDGSEGRHAADVARTIVGAQILLADGSGTVAHAQVSQVHRGSLTARVQELSTAPMPDPRFVLVQALAKGDRDLLAIEAATELGVDEVIPWQADRSIVRWRGDRAAKAARKWEQTVLAAAKQSRRPRLPVLAPLTGRAELTARIASAAAAFVLHEDAEIPLASVSLPDTGEVLIVVGPEGGIHDDERRAFSAAGAVPVRLGPHVLRTSTAGAAALSLLSGRDRWR